MPKPEKTETIAELRRQVESAAALYFLDFTRIGANEFNWLRRRLSESGASVRVVKNRLAIRALSESGIKGDVAPLLRGPTSLVFAGRDALAPARVIRDALKTLQMLQVKGAYLDRTVYGAADFTYLASLPTKEELQRQLVGAVLAPLWGFASTLNQVLAEFVFVLDQLETRKAESAPVGS